MTTVLSLNPKEKAEITYPFCWQNDTFTDNELTAITQYGENLELETGAVVGDDGESTTSPNRQSSIKFFQPDGNNNWIFEKLSRTLSSVNDRYYGFDLTGYDAVQYTEYSTIGAKYDWHMDTIMGSKKSDKMIQTRKLSMTMPLNDPSEYEGGEFQIQTGLPEQPLIVDQKRGTAIIFPSFMLHRVTPVTSGVRKSIVVWAVGPKFK
jgi:PKHD-type hydroxylase